jgi:hypothetical protein
MRFSGCGLEGHLVHLVNPVFVSSQDFVPDRGSVLSRHLVAPKSDEGGSVAEADRHSFRPR